MARFRVDLINRNYARLWSGEAVSTVGDYVFDTTLVLWVATVLAKGRTWAPAAVSGILLATGLAVLLVGPISGVFVDRWNRKATMLRTELVRAGLVAVLLVLSLFPVRDIPLPVWLALIYVEVFALNGASQFFSPARFAIIGEVVSGDADRTRAAGIGQATMAVAGIIGPPLAAPLLFTFGVQWALGINAASYLFSYFAVRSVRLASEAQPASAQPAAETEARTRIAGLRAEFAAGLRFFAGSRILIVLLGMAMVAQLGTGAIETLGVFFITGNLHAMAHFFGLISMAFGIGAVVGSLLSGGAVRWLGARRVLWLGCLIGGLLVVLFAKQTTLIAGIVVIGLVAVPIAMLNAAVTPLLLNAAPSEFLGRVLAVFNPLNQLAMMLSIVVAGWLASSALRGFHARIAGIHFGPIDLIYTGAGLLIAASALCGWAALPKDDGSGRE